jgi:hypothetical protein
MPDKPQNQQSDLSPSLQAKLQSYHKALEEEFAEANKLAQAEGEDFEALVRATFKEYTPLACAKIVWLAGNAENETTQLAASKLILTEAFKIAALENDPIKELLKSISSNPTSEGEPLAPANERAKSANKASKKQSS